MSLNHHGSSSQPMRVMVAVGLWVPPAWKEPCRNSWSEGPAAGGPLGKTGLMCLRNSCLANRHYGFLPDLSWVSTGHNSSSTCLHKQSPDFLPHVSMLCMQYMCRYVLFVCTCMGEGVVPVNGEVYFPVTPYLIFCSRISH